MLYLQYNVCGIAILLSGCFGNKPEAPKPKPPFTPSTLDDKARGITITSSKPYNCKIVGESEGYEEVGNTSGATKQKMRQGAINQLKNESVYAIKEGQKVMIAIAKEEMKCRIKTEVPSETNKKKMETKISEVDCTTWDPIPANADIISYRIYGDLYDCGQK
ncbi:hypothetical protein CQA53_01125 [Helicobacter didelphidarum]|uniref:DUF4156 domain-containing protein n=1 Tax=Helicobacter didelphidarum TaxID=2040648 RepID=A0A3D8IRS5_9HELI|nr:hypothetical protein [Helicobacter didelphidarum]RDU67636.1 hypothetical protein CQA53_01125 [Helicobacter didelphidarum]